MEVNQPSSLPLPNETLPHPLVHVTKLGAAIPRNYCRLGSTAGYAASYGRKDGRATRMRRDHGILAIEHGSWLGVASAGSSENPNEGHRSLLGQCFDGRDGRANRSAQESCCGADLRGEPTRTSSIPSYPRNTPPPERDRNERGRCLSDIDDAPSAQYVKNILSTSEVVE